MTANLFYKEFEEKFYAPRSRIKELRQQYIPFVKPLVEVYPGGSIYDAGCGRGEWLELMRETGFKPFGVDLDDGMLSDCEARGLPCLKGDAVDYMKGLPSESQVVVSAFHVVEHISFEKLQTFVQEAKRVLMPGGLLIMETPNSENIVVGIRDFYQDPTHIRPIPFTLLKFLPDYYGFETVNVIRLQEDKALREKACVSLQDVLLGVSPDYAVIAQKERGGEGLPDYDDVFSVEYGVSLEAIASRFDSKLLSAFDQIVELNKASSALKEENDGLKLNLTELAERIGDLVAKAEQDRSQLAYLSNIIKKAEDKKNASMIILVRERGAVLANEIIRRTLDGFEPIFVLIMRLFGRNAAFKNSISRYLKSKYPALYGQLVSMALRNGVDRGGAVVNDFTSIYFNDFELLFDNSALQDNRGIGRVARELLRNLNLVASSEGKSNRNSHRKVYFYPSIHWCPTELPNPSVVMIHDVTPLVLSDIFPGDVVANWSGLYKEIASKAERIVTISESSAKDISSFLEINRTKIVVNYNGVSELPINTEGAKKINLPNRPYFVYLGAYDHHKNLAVALEALSFPEAEGYEIVLIGQNSGAKKIVDSLKLEGRVHFLGPMGDGEVGLVINGSKALLFPSLYEGFGLPPLEAAKLGIPSICSRRPAMTELLKEAAYFVDPYSPEEWASAMKNVVEDLELRRSIISAAEKAVEDLSWSNSAARLVRYLREAAC